MTTIYLLGEKVFGLNPGGGEDEQGYKRSRAAVDYDKHVVERSRRRD